MEKLETLSMFWERTAGFSSDSLPHHAGFQTNDHLPLKISSDGHMETFIGSTVVFPLPEYVRQEIASVQARLYHRCAPVLAEPLEASSFHITLHDLLSGKPSQELRCRIEHAQGPALQCVKRITETRETVRLHSTALFNMVGTSMVLGFAPADEESCSRLMRYYELLQEVVHLNYPLTPHVTVSYFRPGYITAEYVAKLQETIDEVNSRQNRIFVELPAETLEYQTFSDMNHYDIFEDR